jgi:hypothetical protein
MLNLLAIIDVLYRDPADPRHRTLARSARPDNDSTTPAAGNQESA